MRSVVGKSGLNRLLCFFLSLYIYHFLSISVSSLKSHSHASFLNSSTLSSSSFSSFLFSSISSSSSLSSSPHSTSSMPSPSSSTSPSSLPLYHHHHHLFLLLAFSLSPFLLPSLLLHITITICSPSHSHRPKTSMESKLIFLCRFTFICIQYFSASSLSSFFSHARITRSRTSVFCFLVS